MLLDSNPHLLSAKTQDYPLGYLGIMINYIQISINRKISSALFTKIHEDWVKGHWIFICLGSILTNNRSVRRYTIYMFVRLKLRSEIVWHRFFAVPAFIRRFRSYIAARNLFLKTSPNFSSRFWGNTRFWQSPDILRKIRKVRNAPTD